MKNTTTASNTVVPSLLALEELGFVISFERVGDSDLARAACGEQSYSAEDPAAVLGLVKLVEMRGWEWRATDEEFDRCLRQCPLG